MNTEKRLLRKRSNRQDLREMCSEEGQRVFHENLASGFSFFPYQNIRSLVYISRKLAARLRLIFAARLPQTRFSYANYFSGALFWHTMCAASMQRTVVAHCSGTQCAPQVCGAQLPRTVLAHNVCRKYAVHSCRALFWHTMCAASLQRTVVAHYSCVPQLCGAQLPCTALFCPPTTPTPHPTPGLSSPLPYFLGHRSQRLQ